MLYDAHNHLQFAEISAHLDAVLPALHEIRLGGAVVNGTHPGEDWDDVAALAARFDWVIPSFGIHPWDVGQRPADWREKFSARLTAHPAAAVGEIGVDRWMLDTARPDDPRLAGCRRADWDEQVEVFTWQLREAAAHNRTATIHCLQSWGPMLELLENTPLPARGFLLHAYGGSAEMVPRFAALGARFSYNPSFIDPRKTQRREAFRAVPADRLLVETDAPGTPPPEPAFQLPGSRPEDRLNHPANLAAAYADLATLRDTPPAELETQVAANFRQLFGGQRS